MKIFVITAGWYEDERIYAVAATEEEAREIVARIDAAAQCKSDEGIIYGPFEPGELKPCDDHGKLTCSLCVPMI